MPTREPWSCTVPCCGGRGRNSCPVPARHRRPTPIRSPPTRWVRPSLQDRSTIAAVIWGSSSVSAAHWRGCRQVPCPSTSGSRWPAAHPHRGRSGRTGCAGARNDGRRVMTTMVVDLAEYSVAAAMTVGQLRDLIGDLADDTPLHIGVYGHHHFNSVLGTMPVTSARVEPIPGGVIVLLHVPGIS